MGTILKIRHLTKRYYDGALENKVVDDVSLDVNEGEFVVVMGTSGSGKTSLLHLIAGIDNCDGGEIRYVLPYNNCSLKSMKRKHRIHSRCEQKEDYIDFTHMTEKEKAVFRRTNIGLVFQQQCMIPDLTVFENIMLPMMLARHPHKEKDGRLCKQHRDAGIDSRKNEVLNLCSQFGLEEHVRKYPSQLSGGQQQRAAILRSVVNRPPLLLCDEPTGSLNLAQTELVMELLEELNQNGQTIILVTHDRKAAVRGKRVIYIADGHIEGELKFAETDRKEADYRKADCREEELTRFLEERGW